MRKTSAIYRSDASMGGLAVPLAASAIYSSRNGFMGIAFHPSRITDLVATSTCGASTVQLKWTAPGNDGDENTTAGAFVIKYSTVASESPALSDEKFFAATTLPAPPAPGIRGTAHTQGVAGLTAGVVYYFAVRAAERDGMGGVLSAGAATLGALLTRLAQSPYGINLSTAGAAATVSWLPVVRYEDRVSFAVPSAPTAGELSGYRVYRSTTPIRTDESPVPWDQVAIVSTATLAWTDAASGPEYYYAVRAQTYDTCLSTEVLSQRSMIRSAASFDAYSVAPDDQSYFQIPSSLTGPLTGTAGDPASAYAIVASSNGQDLGDRVYKSVEYSAYRGGLTLDTDFSLDGMGRMYLHYEISGDSMTPSFMGTAASPDNASVYWWNGMKWLQLYGKGNALAQHLFLETKYFGKYQIRSVERAGGFSFNLAGLSNRFTTPNGDGKNDNVIFTFNNPRDAVIRGRILDLRGRVVVSDLSPGPVQNSLQWDGTANGRGVPGGVYIYRLEGDGQSYAGTIVILK